MRKSVLHVLSHALDATLDLLVRALAALPAFVGVIVFYTLAFNTMIEIVDKFAPKGDWNGIIAWVITFLLFNWAIWSIEYLDRGKLRRKYSRSRWF